MSNLINIYTTTLLNQDMFIFKHTVKTRYGLKGNVDAKLIVYALTYVYEKICDKAIVVSGDGDFAILAEFLEKEALSAFIVPNKQTVSILIKKVLYRSETVNIYFLFKMFRFFLQR